MLSQEFNLPPSLQRDTLPFSRRNICLLNSDPDKGFCFFNATLTALFSSNFLVLYRQLRVLKKIFSETSVYSTHLNKPFPSSTLTWMEVQERILNNIKKFVTITRQHSKLEDISGQKIFEDLSLYDSEYNALWDSLRQDKDMMISTWAAKLPKVCCLRQQTWRKISKYLESYFNLRVLLSLKKYVDLALELKDTYQQLPRLQDCIYKLYRSKYSDLVDDIRAVRLFKSQLSVDPEYGYYSYALYSIPALLVVGLSLPRDIIYRVCSLAELVYYEEKEEEQENSIFGLDVEKSLECITTNVLPKIAKQYTPLAIVSLETFYEPDSYEDQCSTFHTNFNSSNERLFKVCNEEMILPLLQSMLIDSKYQVVNAMGHTLECTSVILTVSFKGQERNGLHQYSIVKSNNQWFLVDDNNTSRTTLNIGPKPWESTTFLAYLRADIKESSNYQVVFGLIFIYSYSNVYLAQQWRKFRNYDIPELFAALRRYSKAVCANVKAFYHGDIEKYSDFILHNFEQLNMLSQEFKETNNSIYSFALRASTKCTSFMHFSESLEYVSPNKTYYCISSKKLLLPERPTYEGSRLTSFAEQEIDTLDIASTIANFEVLSLLLSYLKVKDKEGGNFEKRRELLQKMFSKAYLLDENYLELQLKSEIFLRSDRLNEAANSITKSDIEKIYGSKKIRSKPSRGVPKYIDNHQSYLMPRRRIIV